jgi:hypothetical protein
MKQRETQDMKASAAYAKTRALCRCCLSAMRRRYGAAQYAAPRAHDAQPVAAAASFAMPCRCRLALFAVTLPPTSAFWRYSFAPQRVRMRGARRGADDAAARRAKSSQARRLFRFSELLLAIFRLPGFRRLMLYAAIDIIFVFTPLPPFSFRRHDAAFADTFRWFSISHFSFFAVFRCRCHADASAG